MRGDGHVDNSSAIVRADDEEEEPPEGDGRHDEEVGGHDRRTLTGDAGGAIDLRRPAGVGVRGFPGATTAVTGP
jgi:hypothetical protein